MLVGKAFRKISRKFAGEHPCQSVISMKLQSNFIEFTLRHGFSPVNLLHPFRTPFIKYRAASETTNKCFYRFSFLAYKIETVLFFVSFLRYQQNNRKRPGFCVLQKKLGFIRQYLNSYIKVEGFRKYFIHTYNV